MLKLILILGAVVVAVYVLFQYVLPAVMTVALLIHEGLFRKGDEAEKPPPVYAPAPDHAAYTGLAREAFAFSTCPHVTTVSEVVVLPFETFLMRTVSDAFGKRMYVETQRRVDKTLDTVLCAYVDGKLVASASTETPVSQVRWDAYFASLEDLRVGGPHVSFIDDRGHRREARLRTQGGHHA